ncbi:hypothetical protein [Pontibacillus marinus]|uniref:Uncharacterized protein n=1 Tax=Pontibacillus marinus BH030004 = DSM 16465 TaxID=1385511 RepID=A0A0A5GK67_9BACI|nr:hypothetical protein [Pontibacillus marinus]KGX91520.1 hypothetical protein N783_07620 [Pontibacillus marinus BH030004 = DSM 16465]
MEDVQLDSIRINNKVNDFLEFYELANNNDLNHKERWLLWKEHYNFAAIPPGDEGKEIAKRMFHQSWEKYHEHIDHIKQWEPNNERIQYSLSKVKQLLAYNEPIRITVFYFVGFWFF